MGHSTRRLLDMVLETLFPRACVLCGRSLAGEPGRGYPLCSGCERDLAKPEQPRCRVCGKSLISERDVCMRCRDREFAFDSIFPLWIYRGAVKDLVIAYKARNVRSLSRFFGKRVQEHLGVLGSGIPVIPVPYRKARMRKQGWDPVEEMARFLSRRGIPVLRCLERLPGPSQKVLDYSARLSNLAGKIRIRPDSPVPARVLLLDDVLTTGATLSECARVLKGGGAERVDAVVLAAD